MKFNLPLFAQFKFKNYGRFRSKKKRFNKGTKGWKEQSQTLTNPSQQHLDLIKELNTVMLHRKFPDKFALPITVKMGPKELEMLEKGASKKLLYRILATKEEHLKKTNGVLKDVELLTTHMQFRKAEFLLKLAKWEGLSCWKPFFDMYLDNHQVKNAFLLLEKLLTIHKLVPDEEITLMFIQKSKDIRLIRTKDVAKLYKMVDSLDSSKFDLALCNKIVKLLGGSKKPHLVFQFVETRMGNDSDKIPLDEETYELLFDTILRLAKDPEEHALGLAKATEYFVKLQNDSTIKTQTFVPKFCEAFSYSDDVEVLKSAKSHYKMFYKNLKDGEYSENPPKTPQKLKTLTPKFDKSLIFLTPDQIKLLSPKLVPSKAVQNRYLRVLHALKKLKKPGEESNV
ncbi:unnamed protein product [Ambrosiozyma monospora]|uniref:Unnamed protein product n=1 Tax=Ambrosiozyma monospora TaxID=43982 RepID=A0ACB5SXP7_AMBMO|nr:unnamed protein product [Ambrosiozyma monospora]